MGSELRMWVSDKLMSLLGYSQSTVVSYVLNLGTSFSYILINNCCGNIVHNINFHAAKKASSAANLTSQLVDDMGMSSSSETRVFAQEIFERVEQKKTGPNVSFSLQFQLFHRVRLASILLGKTLCFIL